MKDNVLKLDSRRTIYHFISEHPGLHLRELNRRIDMSFGALRYHINYLEEHEHIVSKMWGGYSRYYVKNKIGCRDKKLISLMQQKIPRRIILLLVLYGHKTGYTMKELNVLTRLWKKPYDFLFNLCKHQTTLDFHLNKLIEDNIIERFRVGKKIKYRLKDDEMIWHFLITYQNELSDDDLVDLTLKWFNSFNIPLVTDQTTDALFDVFPQPFRI